MFRERETFNYSLDLDLQIIVSVHWVSACRSDGLTSREVRISVHGIQLLKHPEVYEA